MPVEDLPAISELARAADHRPLRIISVMTTPARGGAEFAAIELLDALAELGDETFMISDQPGIVRDTRVNFVPIDIGPKLARSSWRGLLLQWPRLVRRLRAALEPLAPFDVLLVHYKKEQLLTLFLPRRLRATVVWAEWGPVPFPLRRGLPRILYLAAARRAALVMAISAGTKQSVSDVGVASGKVVVVPNAVRTQEIAFTQEGRERVRARLGIPESAFVVGCVSRFHPKKRNDVVVDAVGLLPPDAHLILAGDGETEAELRAAAEPLGSRVHFIPTPSGDIADVLSAFDVSVFCPSPTEGQPRAVIIAMLAERPVISTGAEGVSDMIDTGIGRICTPENDPAALAAVLREYLDDPELAARNGREARRRAVDTYAALTVAEGIESLMRDAAARQARVDGTRAVGSRGG